jgi:hypothetical protein
MALQNCPHCGQIMTNVSTDPNKHDWQCQNFRCLNYSSHRGKKCSVCGKPPVTVKVLGVNATEYTCEDGHVFSG